MSVPLKAEEKRPEKWPEKWDVHTHTTLSPETYNALDKYASRYSDFVRIKAHETKPCCADMVNSRGETLRVIEDDAYNGQVRIDACDKHGVSMQVISPTPMMIPYYVQDKNNAIEICKILNDDNARLVSEFPNRFTALGALPMQHTDAAIQEMRRIKDLGMHGIEVNSNIAGLDLDEARFFPIFEAAAEMNMAIFIHPWSGFMSPGEERLKSRMNAARNWRPWLTGMPLETALAFDAMARGCVHEKLPNLRVLYAHGGGSFPSLLGRLEHGAYCRPDLFSNCSNKDIWSTIKDCSVYTDSLTHNPWALKMLCDVLGSRRIAMGSDYPYPLGEIDPFDKTSKCDPKGNMSPYKETKNIYPGHMIENLPSSEDEQENAWEHFNWLHPDNADGMRDLPILTQNQKENMLHKTAKTWLGLA